MIEDLRAEMQRLKVHQPEPITAEILSQVFTPVAVRQLQNLPTSAPWISEMLNIFEHHFDVMTETDDTLLQIWKLVIHQHFRYKDMLQSPANMYQQLSTSIPNIPTDTYDAPSSSSHHVKPYHLTSHEALRQGATQEKQTDFQRHADVHL